MSLHTSAELPVAALHPTTDELSAPETAKASSVAKARARWSPLPGFGLALLGIGAEAFGFHSVAYGLLVGGFMLVGMGPLTAARLQRASSARLSQTNTLH